MAEPWYLAVPATEPLSQGDLIMRCPLFTWRLDAIDPSGDLESAETLRQSITAVRMDAVVMTQVCDLENNKVENVVLSPHFSLERYREAWERAERERGQNVSDRSWRRHYELIRMRAIPNLSLLNQGETGGLTIGRRVVDFHDLYTAPRSFLEALLEKGGQPRLRLGDAYRINLSQEFASFFMRVGLSTPLPGP